MSELNFRLEVFEGPLDLLLHLISKNKVNIFNIPISLITTQYMEYLSMMEEMNLDISSEFITMAAKLLYIKSRVLLPQYDEEEEEEDPRQELILSLAEYKKYKDISAFFDDRKAICDYIYFRETSQTDSYKSDAEFELIPIDKLTMAFSAVMERFEKSLPPSKYMFSGIVGREPVSVKSKVSSIRSKLQISGQVEFDSLFETVESRSEIVAIFLAILEMVRNDAVLLHYENEKIILSEGENDTENE
ncbi:MAG: segregation/condensation protein A [Clostridia bacterium]|nr:segregation/condensation protein A [Clostridia bacterium]